MSVNRMSQQDTDKNTDLNEIVKVVELLDISVIDDHDHDQTGILDSNCSYNEHKRMMQYCEDVSKKCIPIIENIENK